MRCRLDGSSVEEIATGFWNSFDLKFMLERRLLLTDNDPDSRGPNRLVEIVPGGDYGYKSMYGGSGIHPYLSWNGELPGTLPYAAALGEAPCSLIDAGYTNFPEDYAKNVLVNIWEENSIVRIPLWDYKSSVMGTTEVIVQGKSDFHPVAFATNSKGDLYFTDWVVRQYPVHSHGRIWRLSAKNPKSMDDVQNQKQTINRFTWPDLNSSEDDILKGLKSDDPFIQTRARNVLRLPDNDDLAQKLITNPDAGIRLQALLTFQKISNPLDKSILKELLKDDSEAVRRMALIYIGRNSRLDLYEEVNQSLYKGYITTPLFETFLATLRHLDANYISDLKTRKYDKSNKLKRTLPPNYVLSIIKNENIDPDTRAVGMRYLEDPTKYLSELTSLLRKSTNEQLSIAILKSLKSVSSSEVARIMSETVMNKTLPPDVRYQAITLLSYQPYNGCNDLLPLLNENDPLLLEMAVNYLCSCPNNEIVADKVAEKQSMALTSIWERCKGIDDKPANDAVWLNVVDQNGIASKGK